MSQTTSTPHNQGDSWAERFARRITHFAGSTPAFLLATASVVVWALLGPLFSYSQTWQLVINTATTIVTFLMVFLIQRSQNKDSLAVHLKMNELIAALHGASNRLISAEELGESELETLRLHYSELARLAATEADLLKSHSIDEAKARHHSKLGRGDGAQ